MKTHLKTYIAASVLGALSVTTQHSEAAVLLSETFDYADGAALSGLSGGTGWSAAWSLSGSVNSATIQDGEMVAWTESTSGFPFRNFSAISGHDKLYISVDFNNLDNPYYAYSVNFFGGSSTVIQIGQGSLRGEWGVSLPGVTSPGWINSGVNSRDEPNFQRMVLILDFASSEAYFYMTPDIYAPEPILQKITVTGANLANAGLNNLTQIRIGVSAAFSEPGLPNGDRYFDNIVVATQWSDLASVIIPEPGSVMLFGMGGLILLAVRRRRSAMQST